MRVIHLARKPLGEATVASNVLVHGTGALHISATRVGYTSAEDQGSARPGGATTSKEGGDPKPDAGRDLDRVPFTPSDNTAGRWPANVILEHRPGCLRTGLAKVPGTGLRGTTTVTRDTDVRWKPHLNPKSKVETGRAQHVWGYSNPDGTETVEAWQCEPGCPVADLDAQSGDRPVSGAAKIGRPARGGAGTGVVQFGVEDGNGTLHNDSGGASRFFKQLGGQKSWTTT